MDEPDETQTEEWQRHQHAMKKRLILDDSFHWRIPTAATGPLDDGRPALTRVGGVDLSFFKEDPSRAVAALVVLDFDTLEVVYERCREVELNVPYMPGYLAFREAPPLAALIEDMKATSDESVWPQLLLVDGNGILHPRGFGLACHLGLLVDIPTVGVSKNIHTVDGITREVARELASRHLTTAPSHHLLKGDTRGVLGAIYRPTDDATVPLIVSCGHRVSLDTALKILPHLSKHRVAEPIRQADIRSRAMVRRLANKAAETE
ncbi:unnamed protein product [Vitrella brassicaformis CCMP3155]|uniref:Endonuclease V n=1 Tax=Vitrella brassicaformis (strain CCMP3155) TaxID=1169540 RepID=A0A0G4GBH5_VITBC|nr:unnamed protein product [Vitrella brassicaformis CCMP3155]|mmetsp:Transcript_49609/g.124402  ORF Transcript_49609/g.124402 Transcript_49609/m.124402 type:complete len:263 (-) Transcript_49609:169-957(-)|eukprot:CEM26472.1 unnamed protein product [Vitrella brassicaformis CCMP3155]